MSTFGDRLRWLLDEHLRVKHVEFAEQMEVGPELLSRWVNNVNVPRSTRMAKVAKLTGASRAWLITGEGPRFSSDVATDAGGDRGSVHEQVAVYDRWDGEVVPGVSLHEAERLLAEHVTNPELLRRQARTPIGDDVIEGIKSILVRLDLTEQQKNALDAYLNRIHAEAKGKR